MSTDREILLSVDRLRSRLGREPDFERRLEDLHDRDWVWWSGAVAGDLVKVDVQAFSLPVSLWPLTSVIEWADGEVVAKGDWTEPGS